MEGYLNIGSMVKAALKWGTQGGILKMMVWIVMEYIDNKQLDK